MSGFEVVGVVLGAIPLLIVVLEHYADGVSTIKSMMEYENVFVDSQSRLILSLATFEQSCRQLLRELPDKRIRDLIDRREGWDSPDLEEVLQRRLGRDFALYKVAVKQLNRRINLLRRKLKLREDLTAPFMVGEKVDDKLRRHFLKWSWSRIQGGFNAAKHKQLVVEIRDDVDQLCTFTKGAIELELEEAEHEKLLPVSLKYWVTIRAHTNGLHKALRSIWPRSCLSHAHQANLRLETPNDNGSYGAPPQFSCSFRMGESTIPLALLPWTGRDVTVLSVKTPLSTQTYIQKRKARFDAPTVVIDPVQAPEPPCLSATKIDNLCTALSNHFQEGSCIGFLPSQEWNYHIHDCAYSTRSLVPLHEILQWKNEEKPTTRQRRTLALALASAVLQLYDTPWLHDTWTIDDIYIDASPSPNTSHLHVVQTFSPTESSLDQERLRQTAHDQLLVKNHTLFALAIALLELTYGAPLAARRTSLDLDDAFTPYRTANRLAKKIQQDELPRFASVVGWCMYPIPKTACDFDFANEGFRQHYFQHVMIPLMEDYKELFSR